MLQIEADMDVTLKAETEPEAEPDTPNMTEEERRKKKGRKKRSQMKRKKQREANKMSSESGTEASISDSFNVGSHDSTDGLTVVDEAEQVTFHVCNPRANLYCNVSFLRR